MSRLSNITGWALAVTLFGTVVAWGNLTGLGIGADQLLYDDIALPRVAVAVVGAVIVWLLLAWMLSRGNVLSVDATWGLLAALAVWALVSALASHTVLAWLGQSERLEGVLTIVLYGALFSAGLQIGRSRRFLRRASAAVALGGTLAAALGMLQVFKVDPTDYSVAGTDFYMGSAFGSLGNPNFLGALLVLTLPLAVSLALASKSTLQKALWALASALMAAATYFTYSQGAWVAVVAEVALAVGLLAQARRARGAGDGRVVAGWRRLLPVGVAAVLGLALVLGVTMLGAKYGSRLWGAGLKETGSGRIMLLQTTASAVAKHPLTGYGPDNFLQAFRANRPDRWVEVFGKNLTNANAHFWLAQYAATLGIPGALLLAAVLGSALVRGRPKAEEVHLDDLAWLPAAGIWVACVGFVVQMMFNVATPASTLPFFALAGMAAAPRARRIEVGPTAGPAALIVLAPLLVAGLVFSARFIAADAAFLRSRLAFHQVIDADATALAEKAARLNPLSIKYIRAVAEMKVTPVLMETSQRAEPSVVTAAYADALTAFEVALQKSPDDYAALCWLAALQGQTGGYLKDATLLADAVGTAERAASLDRTHWEVAELASGNTSQAAIHSALGTLALP